MSFKHEAKFNEMTERAFHWHMQDIDTLKSKVQRLNHELPRTFVWKMKRKDLVNALLADRFGNDAVMDYISQIKQWKDDEAFVNGTA